MKDNEIDTEESKIICLNMKTGVLYKTKKENITKLDLFQLPLKKIPNKSCKHCYGRGYMGRDVNLDYYAPCSCIKKIIDINAMNDIKKAIAENINQDAEKIESE